MQITVYGPLRAATGAKTVTVDVEGDDATVGDALEAFLEAYPRARTQVRTDDGDLRPSVRLTRDGERVGLEAVCPADAQLQLFPAMQGGRG